MMDKYKQQEEVNQDLLKQIELFEEHGDMGDTVGFAEEMKRIYADRDSVKRTNFLNLSDKGLMAKNKLAQSAQKYQGPRDLSFATMPKISEDLDEANMHDSESHDSKKQSRDMSSKRLM